jgi:4-aminobutyrate aminotransferase
MQGLRALADEHGILLICDEIQSGFGRTGMWFGYEHFDIRPDILTMAKGLASGMPISAVAASLDLMAKWVPGSHGGTYGGNAVAAAAAAATIRTLRDEKLIENAQARGTQLMTGLSHLREDFPQISDVRGLGLMVATEFRSGDRKPDGQKAKAVAGAAFERGLMLLTCGPWGNVVRWIPPLIVTEDLINEALGIFKEALG